MWEFFFVKLLAWTRTVSQIFFCEFCETFGPLVLNFLLINYFEKEGIVTRSRWRLKRLRAEPPPVCEPRISQGHVIKGSCDIMGRSPSREAIILSNLVAIDTIKIKIWWFLFPTWPCKTTWSKGDVTLKLGTH